MSIYVYVYVYLVYCFVRSCIDRTLRKEYNSYRNNCKCKYSNLSLCLCSKLTSLK
jgi:hypothetical protein